MARPILDDFNGSILDAENDTLYKLTVTKSFTNAEGQRELLKVDFDLGHESVSELVFTKMDAKKFKWQKYVPPTTSEKEAGKKGHFERMKK